MFRLLLLNSEDNTLFVASVPYIDYDSTDHDVFFYTGAADSLFVIHIEDSDLVRLIFREIFIRGSYDFSSYPGRFCN